MKWCKKTHGSGKERRRSGFSLIELIVVISIMVVLVALLAPAFARFIEHARREACIKRRETISTNVDAGASIGDRNIFQVLEDVAFINFFHCEHGTADNLSYITGVCRSGGEYTVYYSSDRKRVAGISCSVHGDEGECYIHELETEPSGGGGGSTPTPEPDPDPTPDPTPDPEPEPDPEPTPEPEPDPTLDNTGRLWYDVNSAPNNYTRTVQTGEVVKTNRGEYFVYVKNTRTVTNRDYSWYESLDTLVNNAQAVKLTYATQIYYEEDGLTNVNVPKGSVWVSKDRKTFAVCWEYAAQGQNLTSTNSLAPNKWLVLPTTITDAGVEYPNTSNMKAALAAVGVSLRAAVN